MIRYIFVIFFVTFYINAFSQKQDYVWLYGSESYDIILPERAADTTLGASNIDFNFAPPQNIL